MSFEVEPTATLPDVWMITPTVFADERGEFSETWRRDRFADIGIHADFVQDNRSVSARGVLRGLHYQVPPQAQAKLVRVAYGRVFDVAVDLRRSSPTFGRWAGSELSAENHRMMWVPEGFAHGFVTISETAVVSYKASHVYAPEADRAVRWDDPEIGIEWPDVGALSLSDKDAAAPMLAAADLFP